MHPKCDTIAWLRDGQTEEKGDRTKHQRHQSVSWLRMPCDQPLPEDTSMLLPGSLSPWERPQPQTEITPSIGHSSEGSKTASKTALSSLKKKDAAMCFNMDVDIMQSEISHPDQ